jgi:hypothetical protein
VSALPEDVGVSIHLRPRRNSITQVVWSFRSVRLHGDGSGDAHQGLIRVALFLSFPEERAKSDENIMHPLTLNREKMRPCKKSVQPLCYLS